jgi:hypothetical protein
MNGTPGRNRAAGALLAMTAAFAAMAGLAAKPVLTASAGAPSAPAATTVDKTAPPTMDTGPAAERDEVRIAQMHDRLKITRGQEALWSDVARTMRSNDAEMYKLTAARHDKAATMTAVEDLRSYGAIAEAHATAVRAFVPTFEKLYDSMSAAQKANADVVFRNAAEKKRKGAVTQ